MATSIPPGNLCDAACMKIIIDSGFTAIAARVLSKEMPSLTEVACRLAEVCDRYKEAYDFAIENGVLKKGKKALKWDGCHRATEIMAWVTARAKSQSVVLNEVEITAKLAQWTQEIIEAMTALMAGAQFEEGE